MATFNYYLREPKSDKKTPIVLFVSCNSKVKKIRTEQSIEPKYWDSAKQKVKQSFPGSTELNVLLASYLLKAQKSFTESMAEGIRPSAQHLREKVETPKSKWKGDIQTNYLAFIDAVTPLRAPNTVKKHVAAFNQLVKFQNLKNDFRKFDNVNQIFYDQFLNYLLTNAGLNNNTAYKYIKVFKTFMQWTFDREIHQNISFKRFKVKEFPVDVIYLSEQELFRLYNLDLRFDKTLAHVRDAFCFSCFTGQRFSDIVQLRWEDIRINTWILHTQKTKELIEVPLNRFALEILRKYKDAPLPLHVLSNQQMNDNLKVLAEKAEIDQRVKIVNYAGNQKIETVYRKHELVTTHVARKTFVTLSLQKGMRPETVMEITGHKDFRTLKKYIKITSRVKEEEMHRIWDKAVA